MKKTVITVIVILAIIAIIVGGIFAIKNKGGMQKELKLQTSEEMQSMLTTIYSNEKVQLPQLENAVIDVSDLMQVTTYTGLQSNENVEELVVSVPFINSQAYSVAIVKVKENADIEKMKQEMLDNIDMRRCLVKNGQNLYMTNLKIMLRMILEKN